jgi:hypothetical protein
MDEKKIILKEGKLLINSKDVLDQIKDQGLEFSNDGSLKVEEGANISVSVTWG